MESDLLLPKEAADYLRTTTAQLNVLRARKIGPSYVKLGRSVRYRRSDLQAYVVRRRKCGGGRAC